MATGAEIPYKPHILVAPLDWGLGHATRCVPVIHELQASGFRVTLAAEGAQASLLKQEFPGLELIPFKGYRVRYGRNAFRLFVRLLLQVPKIRRAIREEHQWLQEAVEEYGFDGVISDNRYGLYHQKIPCVFITHQLLIRTGLGSFADRILQRINYKYVNRFRECWVPDVEAGAPSFAGSLSHPRHKPSIPVQYIGLLSRLAPLDVPVIPGHLFISLSGPEPQRAMLEQIIVDQVSHYNGSATIVRGLPNEQMLIPSTNSLRFYNHLPAARYNEEIAKAEWVIARSGYSTVMDVMKLGKKAILIPTPGQTEQVYLAKHLHDAGLILYRSQKDFKLNEALVSAASKLLVASAQSTESGKPTATVYSPAFGKSANQKLLSALLKSFQ